MRRSPRCGGCAPAAARAFRILTDNTVRFGAETFDGSFSAGSTPIFASKMTPNTDFSAFFKINRKNHPHRGLYWFARPALRISGCTVGFSVGLQPSSPGSTQRSLRKGLLPAGPSFPAGNIRSELSRVRVSGGFSVLVFTFFVRTFLEGNSGAQASAWAPRAAGLLSKKKEVNP